MSTAAPVLLVEDDLLDVRAVRRAFRTLDIPRKLHIARNGREALAYLRREPPFEALGNTPYPALILLDLNLPELNGLEVLEALRRDLQLRGHPVVVLTTSRRREERRACLELGARDYRIKSFDFTEFLATIRELDRDWELTENPRPLE